MNAVLGLELLQNSDGPVPDALLQLLEWDPSPDVRKTVLSIIGISDKTLPGLSVCLFSL